MTENSRDFDTLVTLINKWGDDRNITTPGNSTKQIKKTIEEVLELLEAVVNKDENEIADGLGDTLVTLIILARIERLDLLACLNYAYNQIKDRTGQTINGTFVKDQEDQL